MESRKVIITWIAVTVAVMFALGSVSLSVSEASSLKPVDLR